MNNVFSLTWLKRYTLLSRNLSLLSVLVWRDFPNEDI